MLLLSSCEAAASLFFTEVRQKEQLSLIPAVYLQNDLDSLLDIKGYA